MNEWGSTTFGDPCRGCGFTWSISQTDADSVIAQTPRRFAELIGDRDGSQRDPDLEWTAAGYVCHVADSLRVWSERLANVALGDPGPVAEYNQDTLAVARSYDKVGVRGALWSLDRAVGDWQAAVALAAARGAVMTHAELGEMTVLDVARIRAHDVNHHAGDIERSIRATS